MTYIKSTSGLILPARTGQLSKDRQINLAAIEKWRAQLQLSDLSGSAKALYLTLQDIHQANLSPAARFAILGILQPIMSYLCQTLKKFYHTQDTLSENQRPIADLVYALHIEMLNGYKLVIDDTLKTFFIRKKLLLNAFRNAMYYCTRMLFDAYEQHRPPPLGIWQELHTLYHLAQTKHLTNKSLPKDDSKIVHFKALQDIYKQCLLFVLASPYRLRRNEITYLKYALESWATKLTLQKDDKTANPLFIVDLLSDAPPQYATHYFNPSQNCYFLMMDKVNDHLLKLISAKKNPDHMKVKKLFSESELALPNPFIESLLTAWRNVGERANQRTKAQGYMPIALGITATHWFISQNQTSSHQRNSLTPVVEEINIDILPFPTQGTNTNLNLYQTYLCELVDQSEGGYSLKWLKDTPPQLQCGEIVGLERSVSVNENQKIWSVGTIRWLRNDKDSSIYLGIQVLGLQALAVKARISDPQLSHSVPTLLLSPSHEHSKLMTLITPPLPFKPGQEIEVMYNDTTYSAVLQKSVGLSPSYQEFELEFSSQSIVFPHLLNANQPSDPMVDDQHLF